MSRRIRRSVTAPHDRGATYATRIGRTYSNIEENAPSCAAGKRRSIIVHSNSEAVAYDRSLRSLRTQQIHCHRGIFHFYLLSAEWGDGGTLPYGRYQLWRSRITSFDGRRDGALTGPAYRS